MSDIVSLNGHRSASQRREAALTQLLDEEAAKARHFVSIISVLVVQMGGQAIIPKESLDRAYHIHVVQDKESGAVMYTCEAVAQREAICSSCGKKYVVNGSILPTCDICQKPTDWVLVPDEVTAGAAS